MSKIEELSLVGIAQKQFLNYAMSVIVDRALPDVRDGLKPVNRRILWSMSEMGVRYNTQYKKSARIVGDVIGKYHPHGDTAVYDALVRMAQNFKMRAELIDGQGNYGSIDGDSAAAMRYTECRMSIFATNMFKDIEYNTVRMVNNYDGNEQIPEVLPIRYPNLLVNGTDGIAVGMACSVLPHNPIEVLNCLKECIIDRIKNEPFDLQKYMAILPAPDFPTGGLVHNLKDMENVWLNGRGSVKLRAKWHEEEGKSGNSIIIIDEIPYQVNKEKVILRISELLKPNKQTGKAEIDEIKEFRDESDKEGIRIFIELKKDIEAEVFFNKLIKLTDLENSQSYNINVLVNGEPKTIGMIDVFREFVNHRINIITKRTEYLDLEASKKQHLLGGLIKALEKIDEVIELIKRSKDSNTAKESLIQFLEIDMIQAQSIIDMRLNKLTSGEVEDLKLEIKKLEDDRSNYKEILSSEQKKLEVALQETEEEISLFANVKRNEDRVYSRRLTTYVSHKLNTDLAALTKEEDCTILFSNQGYIRRMPTSQVEMQNRGTRGKKLMKLKNDDFIFSSINSHSHDALLLVTAKGQVYSLYAYEITDSLAGRHINNILQIEKNDKIILIKSLNYEESKNLDLLMVTEKGMVKKTKLEEYSSSFRKSGLIGINLREDDKVVSAEIANETDNIMLVNDKNLIIIFESSQLRSLSRNSIGVRGMNLENSIVIGAGVVSKEGYIVTIAEKGVVKITKESEYKTQSRGGKGVRIFKESEKTGGLFKAITTETLNKDVITTTKNGIINKISLQDISVTGRNTSGVKLIKIDEEDKLADTFIVDKIIEDLEDVLIQDDEILENDINEEE